jgi:hypothetical protein
MQRFGSNSFSRLTLTANAHQQIYITLFLALSRERLYRHNREIVNLPCVRTNPNSPYTTGVLVVIPDPDTYLYIQALSIRSKL